MEFRSAALGSLSESHWKYGNSEHENGLKLWPPCKMEI